MSLFSRVVRTLLPVLAGLMMATGCSRIEHTRPEAATAKSKVWPPAPEQARIAYEQSITRPADLGIRRSAFTRFGQWLTGSEKGNEPLVKPFGIALDENDDLCLTDTGANTVCCYDRAKKKWSRFEKVGKLRFASPVAVAKRSHVLYVADSTLKAVIAFGEDGKLVFVATNGLSRPTGLAISGDKLFVTDSQQHKVVCFALNGRKLSEFGRRGTGPGEFNFPTHITTGAEGKLLVTDSMNSRVQVFDPDGRLLSRLGELGDAPGHFSRPKGLASDSQGNIYVIDALFDNVQIFDPAGQLLLNFGGAGSGPGEFWLPNGIAISRGNEIYVADSYNRRVQLFKYVGPL